MCIESNFVNLSLMWLDHFFFPSLLSHSNSTCGCYVQLTLQCEFLIKEWLSYQEHADVISLGLK